MDNSTEQLELVACGRRTVDEAARALGVGPDEVRRRVETYQLMKAVAQEQSRAEVQRYQRQSRRRAGALAAAALVIVALWGGRGAWAVGNCTQVLPAPLISFCPDEPALASEMNTNFETLHTWIVAKVGTLSSANITGQSASFSGAVSFGSTTRQMLNLFSTQYGIGVQPSTQYFRTGGGFAWFLNGTHADTQNAAGAGGTSLMTLSNAGDLTVTTVNGRRPAFTRTAYCAAGSCQVSCAPGVVKLAFGFHGARPEGYSSSWACGDSNNQGGFQWLGNCMGQTTCTVNTGCGQSGVFAECW